MRCLRCHHPMKHATKSGMGKVCEAKAKPVPVVERDLFGFDIGAACAAATERLRLHIESMAVDALIEMRHAVAAARRKWGVWAQ